MFAASLAIVAVLKRLPTPLRRSMPTLSRDELAEKYLAQLPYPPYPVQEEALLSWFTAAKQASDSWLLLELAFVVLFPEFFGGVVPASVDESHRFHTAQHINAFGRVHRMEADPAEFHSLEC